MLFPFQYLPSNYARIAKFNKKIFHYDKIEVKPSIVLIEREPEEVDEGGAEAAGIMADNDGNATTSKQA